MYSNRLFKTPENISLPKQSIENLYDTTTIPDIYSTLIKRNEEKINRNAKNIEKIAITENFTVASKLKDMFR